MAAPRDDITLPPMSNNAGMLQQLNYPSQVKVGVLPDGQIQWADYSWFKKSWNVLGTAYKKPIIDTLNKVYGENNWDNSEVSSLFSGSVDDSARAIAINSGMPPDQLPSPQEIMIDRIYKLGQNGLRPDGKLATGAGGAGGVSVSFQKSVRLTDPDSARKLMNTALSQYLGKSATTQEQETFLKALNFQEKAAPVMTKSTTTAGGGSSSTSTVTTGGFDPSVFAEEYAQGKEGAGEFKAATSLLDTFIKSIGAKV